MSKRTRKSKLLGKKPEQSIIPRKLEQRYCVFKIDDANKYLNDYQKAQLEDICLCINSGRKGDGKEEWSGLVVGKDWPEYAVVENMIQARLATESADYVDLGPLAFHADWTGGRLTINDLTIGDIIRGKASVEGLALNFNGNIIPVHVGYIEGEDNDHGHVYAWSSYELFVDKSHSEITTIRTGREAISRMTKQGNNVILVCQQRKYYTEDFWKDHPLNTNASAGEHTYMDGEWHNGKEIVRRDPSIIGKEDDI